MKNLIALYKTFRGGEWFRLSLESVMEHCAGAVVVSSDQPWLGAPGTEGRTSATLQENCREPLAKFQRDYPDFPVTEIKLVGRCNTRDQYAAGLTAIREAHGDGYGVLVVDTDEVWETADLERLRRAMTYDVESLYFRSGIWTYLRSPLYRVHPQEAKARVVVGLANPGVPLGESRFSGLHRVVARAKTRIRDVPDCAFHHLCYVRLDPEEITSKMGDTGSQDAVKQRLNWKQEVWDKLPKGVNLHTATRHEAQWLGVVELAVGVLPRVLTTSEAFWATAGHHRNGMPAGALLDDDPTWRAGAEVSERGIATTVPAEHLPAACAAFQGRLDGMDCAFLTPRLRMSFRETLQLAEHARRIPPGGAALKSCALEVGSGLGGSMAVIGRCAPEGTRLVAVDPYVPYDEQNLVMNRAVAVGTTDDFADMMERMGLLAKVRLICQTSAEVAHAWSTPLDLILVDGNHSHGHAIYDLIAWWEKLAPGGVMLLHDLSGRFPGVVRAAREFEAQVELRFNLPLMSSLAWMEKPK